MGKTFLIVPIANFEVGSNPFPALRGIWQKVVDGTWHECTIHDSHVKCLVTCCKDSISGLFGKWDAYSSPHQGWGCGEGGGCGWAMAGRRAGEQSSML